jgi:hypothetical protein
MGVPSFAAILQFSISNFHFSLLFSDRFPAASLIRSSRRIKYELRAVAVFESRCDFDCSATFA